MELHNLKPAEGSIKKGKRIGRGEGSKRGGTSTRGHKGAKSRSGYSRKIGFEGGQMPLYRRLPKRGFRNIFAKKYAIVNVQDLNCFEEGTIVTPVMAQEQGLVKKIHSGLRILGQGKLEKKLTVKAHHFTQSARQKIEEMGGSIEVLS